MAGSPQHPLASQFGIGRDTGGLPERYQTAEVSSTVRVAPLTADPGQTGMVDESRAAVGLSAGNAFLSL